MTAIGPTRRDEIGALQEIERRAAALFHGTGLLPASGESSVADAAQHLTAIEAGLSFTARLGRAPIGFAIGWPQPGSIYLAELAVDPDHGRRGAGRALVEHFCAAAWARGGACVTLSTFRDVPWNAPFYAKLGFREIASADRAGWMAAYEANQARGGLDITKRLFMQLARP